MRRLFFTACFLTAQLVNAQVKIGLQAGFATANQTGLNFYTYTFSPPRQQRVYSEGINGFSGGFFVESNLGKNISLRVKAFYAQEGMVTPTMVDPSGNLILGQEKIKLHCINLPLQVLYNPKLAAGTPWVGVGPYAGAVLSANANGNTIKVGGDKDDAYKFFDIGISGTAGFTFRNGVFAGIDYQHSLVSISQQNSKLRNAMWGFFAGYAITIY